MTTIKTSFVYPPIPDRNFDWCAIDDDTYDGEGCCPIGRGPTEDAAILDLLRQICANHGADCDAPDCTYCGAAIGEKCRAKIIRAALENKNG